MLDIRYIRENPQKAQELLNLRSNSQEYDLVPILELDQQQKELESTRTELQRRSNEIGKLVPQKIKQGENVDQLKQEGNKIKQEINDLEPKEKELKTSIEQLLLTLPNFPSNSTPVGKDEQENVEIKRWGDEFIKSQQVLPHWEIGEKLGILEFEKAVKVAKSRFVALFGAGAALERALISLMLDRHIAAGYTEVMPPILINSESMQGTGQLPKFAAEGFNCPQDDLWLAPTAEVPVTNLYRDEILDLAQLPIYHCAYTPCFRREAGSHGKDTRGLIRLHQFNKIELVKIVSPQTSEKEHQKLLQDAEAILQILKLPYRVIELCTGDLGFGAAKCYDIEVYLPNAGKYREISSCSNFGDFQARRANIRYKESGQKGTNYVHTLNGSGLAVGRTMAAILENYQQIDGKVQVPEALQPYLKREFL
ncbi:MAG: serine--tRNA ligase [Cyanobacteriota bacterium ELA615]